MSANRWLRQPGPASSHRIDSFQDDAHCVRLSLQPGLSLNEAITGPLVAAGWQSGTVGFAETVLQPLRYVIPAVADDASHVAYFSAPRLAAGAAWIERANATFGWAEGKPFIHCHAVWIDADGRRRGGHILPHETIVADPGRAEARCFRALRVGAWADPETNFTLFQPSGGRIGGDSVLARVKPNEDILVAIETIAGRYGIRDGTILGGLGSLVGARFVDGGAVDDHATEVLVQDGFVRDGEARLRLLVVDMGGEVHQGWLRRGDNPVCITFDVVLGGCAVT